MRYLAEESEDEEENDGVQGETGHKDQNVVSAEVSDMDYLKSRVTKALSDDADNDTDAPGDGKASWHLCSSIYVSLAFSPKAEFASCPQLLPSAV